MSNSIQSVPQIVDARLQGLFKALLLPTLAKNYAPLARQAAEQGQAYPDYLLALLEQELSQREVNRRRRLVQQAKFPIAYTLESYDFSVVPSLSKQKVLELARGEFIRKAENLVLVGEIGTGKTHLANALGYAACALGYSVRFFTAAALITQLIEAQEAQQLSRFENALLKQQLIIIDELGFVPLSKTGAELLFELISQRYERGATLITSNLPFDEWTETFGSERLTGALLDRLTHHVNILEMNGESYRLGQSKARQDKA